MHCLNAEQMKKRSLLATAEIYRPSKVGTLPWTEDREGVTSLPAL